MEYTKLKSTDQPYPFEVPYSTGTRRSDAVAKTLFYSIDVDTTSK